MTKEELAAKLDCREIGEEITRTEAFDAKDAGLIVLFGASDDLAEFRGALNDEAGCFEGGELLVTREGKLLPGHEPYCECDFCGYAVAKADSRKIIAKWNDSESDCSWSYETDIPHSTFKILEDGVVYCIGIVFSIADLK